MERAALAGTVTFRRAELSTAHFNRHADSPHITLRVVTPHQVQFWEAYAQRTTDQRFRLSLGVTPVEDKPSPVPLKMSPDMFLSRKLP